MSSWYVSPPARFGGADEKTLTLTLEKSDGGPVTNLSVELFDTKTGLCAGTYPYQNRPLLFTLPTGFAYRVQVKGQLQGYHNPSPLTGVLVQDTACKMVLRRGTRYGFRRRRADSNPNTRIEYIFDAAGKTPMHVDTAKTNRPVFGSGDTWQQFCHEIATPVMLRYDGTEAYQLDRNDQRLKADGSPSDLSNTAFAGNAMVRFSGYPWVHRSQDETFDYVVFSDIQYDETYHAYAHTNEKGQVAPAFYWGMFKGSYSGGRLRSLANQAVMASQTRKTEAARARANGAGYNIIYKSGWDYICDLVTLLSKSDNGQNSFGAGRNNASGVLNPGTLAARPGFWGSNDNTSDVKALFIEGCWGNVWESINGFLGVKGSFKTKMIPPYNFSGEGYLDDGAVPTKEGYVKNARIREHGYIPGDVSGSSTTYYCDEFDITAASLQRTVVCKVGGRYANGNKIGPRFISFAYDETHTAPDSGTRLSYISPEVN